MKIAIEAQRIFRTAKHGMDFVALETIRELQKIDHKNQYRIYVSPGDDHCLEATENFEIEVIPETNYLLFEQIALPAAVRRWKADLLHATSNTAPLNLDIPLVVTLHDVIFMENYGWMGMSNYQKMGRIYRQWVVPRVVKKAKKVITVSDYERDVICETLGLSLLNVDVVYNGVNSRFRPTPLTDEIRKKYSLPEKYLFFIGNTDPKKNTTRVLEAYSLYCEHDTDPLPLVMADISLEDIKSISSYWNSISRNVVLTGYIPTTDMPQIYTGAELFLYPSLRESFGIPPLEAMACGTPVVASDATAIPEILSDAAMLVDPYKPDKIANAIIRLTCNTLFYNYYVSKGIDHSSRYSWRATAQELLKIYEKL